MNAGMLGYSTTRQPSGRRQRKADNFIMKQAEQQRLATLIRAEHDYEAALARGDHWRDADPVFQETAQRANAGCNVILDPIAKRYRQTSEERIN